MIETLEESLLGSAAWLRGNRQYMHADIRPGYDSIIKSIEAGGQRALELQVLCEEAKAFVDGSWDPDDNERAKFLRRLQDITDPEDLEG